MKGLTALISGLLFGAGLSIGGMTDPAKVIGFLDLAGAWDPSLAFVMGAALCITVPSFQLLGKSEKPLLEARFFRPTRTDLDVRLLAGATLFGVGWGIAGFCPGPAIASLSSGSPLVIAFVLAMMAGMWLADRINQWLPPPPPSAKAVASTS
ncbi:MAG: DUF6691 family protein [Panacagrimonas sp.]